MNGIRFKLSSVLAALVLTACGGSDPPALTSMVSFGDSLSDVGTYKVGTIAAVGGGKWTINSPTVQIWPELVAAQLGLPAPCPAQTGLLPNATGFVGAPVTTNAACDDYAQGSARVNSPLGPSAVALQSPPFNDFNIGLLALPVTSQMSLRLAKAGSYSGSELVTIMAGGNDLFMNLIGVGAAPAGGAAAVGAALAAGWPQSVQDAVAAGGAAASNAAATAAVQSMGQAGAELAAAIQSQVLAKGAQHVLVLNLADVSGTPFGLSLDQPSRQLVDAMVSAFNGQLQAGLASTPVILLDTYALTRDQETNPAKYGLTNTTTPACSLTSAANPLAGKSLACTAASTIAGDTSGYLFADDVHPTPLGHQLYARFVIDGMRSAGLL